MAGTGIRSPNALGSRTSVGLVLASLHTGASIAAWPGVARAAERADVNLFCFPGGRLGLSAGYEASRNAIYELAARAPLDGALVWASSLCGAADTAPALDAFVDRYRDIALASLSAGVSGAPIVTFDYYGGMRDAILHAAIAHGYRRIAFIRGPSGHTGAEERLRAYLDTLRELSIEADPRLSSSPFPWDSGGPAAVELMDGRGLLPGRDFEVLVASSDLLALAAAREIQSRGYRIPEDVAIIGMNNGVESRIAAPPLTTVDCPFAELGALGLSTLLEAIEARKAEGCSADSRAATPPAPRRLKTRLVVRRSCGCPAAADPPPPDSRPLELRVADQIGLDPELARDWIAPLVEAWQVPARGGEAGRFLDLLGRVLDRAARAGMELGPWQDAITTMRRDALCVASDALCIEGDALTAVGQARRDALEEAAGRARILAAEAAERAHAFRAWERDKVDLELRELDHELLMAMDARRIGEILRRSLPELGMRSAYLCRYEGEGAAGQASLVAGFRDGEEVQPSTFPAADLLPRAVLPDRRLSYVVEPLFFRDNPIGYALFEIGGAAGAVYERLRDSVSDALRSVILFERVEEARERAERADGIKTRLLTSVTHELRAPVDMILRGASRLLEASGELKISPDTASELERITLGAEHERRLVGDLLDFSRAEIDELDIERKSLDPGALIAEVFDLFSSRRAEGARWTLDLPERMPTMLADPLRLRQILVNLLSNAERHAGGAGVTVSARVEPPDLVVRVEDEGPGIPPERLRHLFEPFLSQGSGGVGLGLSIARHLALLHFGSLEAANAPKGGAAFTLTLPLPDASSLAKAAAGGREAEAQGPCILLISSSDEVPAEVAEAAAARGLGVRRARVKAIEDGTIDGIEAAAIAWDSTSPSAEEAAIFRKLRRRPRLASLPFLLYGGERAAAAFVDKGSGAPGLSEAISLALLDAAGAGSPGQEPAMAGPAAARASIVLADDDAAALASLRRALADRFPEAELFTAGDGEEAWALLRARKPLVAVLDISMPRLSGIEVVALMRSDERLRAVPVVLLTSKVISMEDVRSIEARTRVVLGNKGVLTDEDAASEASRVALGTGSMPAPTSAIVKRGVAFINERYAAPLTRWQLAKAVNASEDYLTRLFRKELGMAPWEYLTRLRIERAKELLAAGSDSVAVVGARVGFPDQAYFSRVFRKVTGRSPQAYRGSPD
jgi:signal transduction histidine kinase/DNA-binding LacI/PurR family transcriptional regulator/AraC-like DNA-binding protein